MVPGRKTLGLVALPIFVLVGRLLLLAPDDASHRTYPNVVVSPLELEQVEHTAFPALVYSVDFREEHSSPTLLHPHLPSAPALTAPQQPAWDDSSTPAPPAQLTTDKVHELSQLQKAPTVRGLSAPSSRSELTVVTAADAGHFLTLVGAVWALRRTESPSTNILVFDLGLKDCQRAYLDRLVACFPGGNSRVRSFDYSQYPAFFNISDRAGSYGWKVAIVNEVLASSLSGSSVVWVDAGTEMGRRVGSLLADSWSYREDGFISTVTSGTLQQWTHDGMVGWFERHIDKTLVATTMARERFNNPCNGAFLGFRAGSPAHLKMIPPWLACALDQACIAPEGSSRRNHRQDQSALTLLTKVHLHAARGCVPLRSDLTIRFWRDIYYEVNAPVVFQGYVRGGGACSPINASSDLVCASTIALPPPTTEPSHVALVLVLTEKAQKDEEALLQTLARLRQTFLPRAHVHVFLVVGKQAGPARLDRVDKAVATDAMVSVLARYDLWTLEGALSGYHLASVLLVAEGSATCLRWEACASLEDCPLAPFRASSLEAFAGAVDAAARGPERWPEAPSLCPRDTAAAISPGRRMGFLDASGRGLSAPLLLPEAASTDKTEIRKVRQLKKALPSKGVVLGLFAETPADRTTLSLGIVLMGALGFGLRWTDSGHLRMAELEKIDQQIVAYSTSDVSVSSSLAAFTRKSKKEVRHAPWIMVSAELERTLPAWRAHLDSVVCVAYAPPRQDGTPAWSAWEGACSGAPTIVVEAFDDWGMYRLFQQLLGVVGNMRALTRGEVSYLKLLHRAQ